MRFLPVFLLLALGACATSPAKLERIGLNEKAMQDPLEETNRKVFKFNQGADKYVLQPVVKGYRRAVPEALRRGVSGYYINVKEAIILPNALAQGKVKSAFRAADRLLINGILGLGLADHASQMGLYSEPHDFGQTMAVWGVPSGPYVMLPFLGPSTLRDSIGQLTDFLLDPSSFVLDTMLTTPWHIAEIGLQFVDLRYRFMQGGEQILLGSADEYATVRSAWLQKRHYELFDGMPPPDDAFDDELDDDVAKDSADDLGAPAEDTPDMDAPDNTPNNVPRATIPAEEKAP